MIARYIKTLAYLKPIQIRYRAMYAFKKKWYRPKAKLAVDNIAVPIINWPTFTVHDYYQPCDHCFELLHLKQAFGKNIQWNFDGHGLLWQFHLHYFHWLHHDELSKHEKLNALNHYCNFAHHSISNKHPYPASLRLRNWIIFCTQHQLNDKTLLQQIARDADCVDAFTEWDLQANHLLENAMSLLWAGLFLQHQPYINKGSILLKQQLKEQILGDGAHVELSPMYHILLTHHLLLTLHFTRQFHHALVATLEITIGKMMSWINCFSYPDGSYPNIGDSTGSFTLSIKIINDLANKLSIDFAASTLQESGFRKIILPQTQLLFKTIAPFPNYQPGHQHADALSFYLWHQGQEIIVDTGISTYQNIKRRLHERSTAAHNTVTIQGQNNAAVWKSFRMGARPQIKLVKDEPNNTEAHLSFDGTPPFQHIRKVCQHDNKIYICDRLIKSNAHKAKYYLHFAPGIEIKKLNENSIQAQNLVIHFKGLSSLEVHLYHYALGFNKTTEAIAIVGTVVTDEIETIIIPTNAD